MNINYRNTMAVLLMTYGDNIFTRYMAMQLIHPYHPSLIREYLWGGCKDGYLIGELELSDVGNYRFTEKGRKKFENEAALMVLAK